jgi:hypothetical protein
LENRPKATVGCCGGGSRRRVRIGRCRKLLMRPLFRHERISS